jgi:large subunit ribosomal protein L3
MIDTIFATKKGMSQAWDNRGRRLAISKFIVESNLVVGENVAAKSRIVEVGYGQKKLRRMTKPLRNRLEKLSLKRGVRQIKGVADSGQDSLTLGQEIAVDSLLKVGAVVQVQGVTKGRGFAGAVKRYNFRGGPKTHGQSDRLRATGSIGNCTTPGRVWLGKRMPGHYGAKTQTVTGLTIAYFNHDSRELWLTGPVPGSFNSVVAIKLMGRVKTNFALNEKASGICSTLSPANSQEKTPEDAAQKTASRSSKTENTAKSQTEDKQESAGEKS